MRDIILSMKILLVRWGGLGDLLVCLPAIRLVRDGLPNSDITLVARGEGAGLLLRAGVVDRVVGPDDRRTLALVPSSGTGERNFQPDRSAWLDGFDLSVTWLNRAPGEVSEPGRGGEEGRRARISIACDGSRRERMSEFFYRRTLQALDSDFQGRPGFAECAGLPLDLLPEAQGHNRPDCGGLGRPQVVIHPGSGGEMKRWPLDNFFEIAGRLQARGAKGALITGEAEAALNERVGTAARSLGWPWLRSPSLAELAPLLGKVRLYLGNDSGVTHLAAACGARVLALFRDEFVDEWRPYGDSRVLSADRVAAVPLEAVWGEVAQMLCN